MNPQPKSTQWYLSLLKKPVAYIGLGVFFLMLDFATGARIGFPIAFALPVVLAAWFSKPPVGYLLAILLPAVRLGFTFIWDSPPELTYVLINFLIRVSVLLFIAHLTQRTARLTREVKVLKGILPICSFCKKIRDRTNTWQPMEVYISHRTEANFSHGICPQCAQIHYGDLLNDGKNSE